MQRIIIEIANYNDLWGHINTSTKNHSYSSATPLQSQVTGHVMMWSHKLVVFISALIESPAAELFR